jgi:protein-S-isoprenylcysteine O-methyltransferase Ste14
MFETILLFAVLSAPLIYISRRSFRAWRAHGFPRFFAFEAFLALVLLNAPFWFADPFSPRQIGSWILLALSLGAATQGFLLLHTIGRPEKPSEPGTNLGFENTTRLVTSGLYRYIRHPLYLSLILGGAGAFLKNPSFAALALVVAAVGFIVMTAKREEDENREHFGPAYDDYVKRTKMFVPFIA